MKSLFAIASFMFLMACQGTGLTPMPPRGPVLPSLDQDTCNANQYTDLIGQDATALEKVMILDQVRVIRPGDAVTMDFRPQRINFGIGPDNRIRSITCN